MSESVDYGSKFWIITGNVGKPLHIMADKIEVASNGALIAWGGYRRPEEEKPKECLALLMLAPGHWESCYAASCIDGSMVVADE